MVPLAVTRSESSPLVHGLSVFLGDQGGTVYSFRTYDGHVNWTFQASGAVKGGVAFAHNTIYFGDYGARVHAVNAANGRELWSAAGGGSFYSTPAVAYGRVYIGSTSGAVYAFWAGSGASLVDRIDGRLRLRLAGGGRRSRSRANGLHRLLRRPLVCLGADTGGMRWSHAGGGRIDGSATVVGNVVYYSGSARTPPPASIWRTGRQVFSFPDGEFTPVITDGKVVFLIGYSTIYQMVPRH